MQEMNFDEEKEDMLNRRARCHYKLLQKLARFEKGQEIQIDNLLSDAEEILRTLKRCE